MPSMTPQRFMELVAEIIESSGLEAARIFVARQAERVSRPLTSGEREHVQTMLDDAQRSVDDRKAKAAMWLTDWAQAVVRHSETLYEQRIRFLDSFFVPSRPPVDLSEERWAPLAEHQALTNWVASAMAEARIAKIYSEGGGRPEAAARSLRRAAESFANEMLGPPEEFDRERVRLQALRLWEDLGSETETYEVGAVVYSVAALHEIEPITIGPKMHLRPVRRPWADERFQSPERAPSGCAAVTAEVS
jgi:hypothetical protein